MTPTTLYSPCAALQPRAASDFGEDKGSLAAGESEVLDDLRCGVIVTDPDGGVLYLNAAARVLTAWHERSIDGVSLADVLRLEPDPLPRRRLHDSLLCTEDNDARVLELVALDGARHPVEISTTPKSQGDGRIVYEIRDIEANVRRTERLIHEATHDSLTGLTNRRELQRRLYDLLNAEDTGKHALVFLDLDGFKRINDECGHLAGDEVLHDIARLLESKMRRADTVARLGGDEFAVLLFGCMLYEAMSIAEELRHIIGDYEFIYSGRTYHVTGSLGVTCVGSDAKGISDIIQSADAACYRAKAAGGNRVCVHDGAVPTRGYDFEKHSLVPRLRKALAEDGFTVHYDVFHALQTATVASKWATVPRVRSASGRLVGREVFMPIASRNSLAMDVDHWLIAHVLDKVRPGAQDSCSAAQYFVSLSAASLENAWATAQFIEHNLRRCAIPAGLLCIELNERDVIANWAATMQLVERLRDCGVSFCLSDFGVGLYTLSYLKRTRMDFIKLSVELVRKLAADPFYFAYIQAIVNVAVSLGIEVICVEVDNDTVLQRLQELGVQYMQAPSGFPYIRAASAQSGLKVVE